MFVVAGVTGNTGSVVAETLLAQGRKVRVIVRDEAKGKPWRDKGAEVAIADVDDKAALVKAFHGASGAYVLSPPDMQSTDLVGQRAKTFDTLADAIEEAKVAHVVLLSSIGAHREKGTGPILSVHIGEQRLAKTSAKLTSIRAAYFLENWGAVAAAAKGAGKLPTFLPPDLRIPMVATRDIGLTAAKALLEGPPASKLDIIELAGPRDYNAHDVAAAFSKVLGREVVADAAPFEAIVPAFTSFGVSKELASLYEEMHRGLADGTVSWEGKNTRLVRGTVDAETIAKALTA